MEALKKLKEHYEQIAGEWNGEDEKGEETALGAKDIAEEIQVLEEIISQYENN